MLAERHEKHIESPDVTAFEDISHCRSMQSQLLASKTLFTNARPYFWTYLLTFTTFPIKSQNQQRWTSPSALLCSREVLRALERNLHDRDKRHGGGVSLKSKEQALPKSCFCLPMSSDIFLVTSLQTNLDAYLFKAQNVCLHMFIKWANTWERHDFMTLQERFLWSSAGIRKWF